MNYLAHARLSFNDPEILLGNMISDYVKGKKKYEYPAQVLKGINLHRHIDTFTDEHEITRQAKEIFRPQYRLYSGALVDIVYDHFLAIDDSEFIDNQLFQFSQQVYIDLDNQLPLMPASFAKMFPYMKEHNWLYNYRLIGGIQQSFRGLVRRSAYLTESDIAFELFNKHYQLLHDCYRQFWATLKPFALSQYLSKD